MSPVEQPLPEGTDAIVEGAGTGGEDQDFGLGTPPASDAESDKAALSSGFVPRQDAGGTDRNGQTSRSGNRDDDAPADLRGALFGQVDNLRGQAGDKVRDFAVAGKDRATTALDDLVRMVEQAADEVEQRLGSHYGDYARRAADGLGGFSQSFKDKDVDELFADARELLKKSPGIAVGTAAAIGFVVARLVRAGIDAGASAGKDASAA